MAALVLIADDEEKLTSIVASYLGNSGFETLVAHEGLTALALFRERKPDCVILDINMPGLDGLEVARLIRKESATPIIFLTAQAAEADTIVGLELGADDYVTKPFSPRELVSRVRAVLRRSPPKGDSPEETLRRGGLAMDIAKREVRIDGIQKSLTAAQFDILLLLARSPGRVFPRLAILEAASGSDFEGYERTVDAHVKNIRKALGDDSGEPRFIGTVRGVGYRFIDQVDAPR
ncbi:MAG: response regulator transcription factor [Spirochaetota bacterium]